MLVNQLSNVKTVFESFCCFLMSFYLLVFATDEMHVAENFEEGSLQCLGNYFHRTEKCANVFVAKARRIIYIRELSSEILDFLLGARAQILSLERDFLRDLVLINLSAVGTGY